MSEPVSPAEGDETMHAEAEVIAGEPTPAGDAAPDTVAPDPAPAVAATTTAAEPTAGGVSEAPDVAALRAQLDERTSDLQRVGAEYANYRRRVERDRALVVEQATAQVVAALLPLLDDLDRAREHDDLTGPFAALGEQLSSTLTKFGLTAFGEVGDAFDPTRHEAVTHQTSADVTVPTCVGVMRRGYLLGDRLLRPALVAVADPESQ
jgi:molecular chaperone GrpE